MTFAGSAKSRTVTFEYNVQVKAAFQGCFNPVTSSMSKDVQAEIILRDAANPSEVIARETVTFDKSTLTATATFSGIEVGEAYVSVKSGNSIETFSKEPVALNQYEINFYDFTLGITQAFASNMYVYRSGSVTTSTIFVGDVDSDGIVDGTDYGMIENDLLNFTSGNVLTDLTGDEFVDASDLQIVEQNSNDYVQTLIPGGSLSSARNSNNGKPDFELKQNYPNPFNPSTMISFALNSASNVRLSVYDMSGRELATLANGSLMPGIHSFKWDASALSSGTYFYRLNVNGAQVVKQMQLIK